MIRKQCTTCNVYKPEEDYYICRGKARTQCKTCTKLKNNAHQKSKGTWKSRDTVTYNAYMRDYYAKNREKFAQYRKTFKDKNPSYRNDYYQNNKEKYDKK